MFQGVSRPTRLGLRIGVNRPLRGIGIVSRAVASLYELGQRIAFRPAASFETTRGACICCILFLVAHTGATGRVSQVVGGRTASIAGRVRTDSGQLPNPVRVTLVGKASTATDETGYFRFPNLEPGRYRVQVFAPGFLVEEFGADSPDEPGTIVSLDAGDDFSGVVVPMRRPGTITGRLMSQTGQPLVGASVRAFETTRQWSPTMDTTTDSLGEFRLGGLYPGAYHLAVIATQEQASSNAAFFRTYLPGTHFMENAIVTTVAAGQTVDVGMFHMPTPDQFTTAQVTVLDSNLVVVAGAPVFAFPAGGGNERPRRAATTDVDGRAAVSGLLPGKYIFTAEVHPPPTTGGRGLEPAIKEPSLSRMWGIVEVDPTPGVTTTAVMFVEPISRLSGRLIGRDLRAEPLTVELRGAACRQCRFSARAQSNGSFTFERLPQGEYDLRLRTHDGALASVEAVVTEAGEQLKPAGDVRVVAGRAVTLMLAPEEQGIEGYAKDATGKPFFGLRIVALPTANDRSRSSQIWSTRPDTKGRYRIANLPNGEYLLLAVKSSELDSLTQDPLGEIRRRGLAVTVKRGLMAVQDLEILGSGQGATDLKRR